jgi:hypothetical protein
MDLYKQAVQLYLTGFRLCFVLPQPPIKLSASGQPLRLFEKGAAWEAQPDFLALDLKGKRLEVVEVARGADAERVRGKIEEQSDPQYRSKIQEWIQKTYPELGFGKYKVDWHFFVRETVAHQVGQERQDVQVSTLEDVFRKLGIPMP